MDHFLNFIFFLLFQIHPQKIAPLEHISFTRSKVGTPKKRFLNVNFQAYVSIHTNIYRTMCLVTK